MKTYRAGIVGLGRIGVEFEDCHLSAYRDCPRTELVMLCDSNEEKVKLWQGYEIMPFEVYSDYMQAVKSMNLDIVSICTPPETHCKIVCDIAPFVKALYCEKPIAMNRSECFLIAEACQRNHTILQVNHQRRFINPVFYYSRGIMNTGTHMFDLLGMLNPDISVIDIIKAEKIGDFNGDPLISGEVRMGKTVIRIEALKTEEPVFKFCPSEILPGQRPLLEGVKSLVKSLDKGLTLPLKSDWRDGMQAIDMVNKFIEKGEDT